MSLLRPTSHLLPLIGWKEDIGLPLLGHGKLVAKVDTGARSAALHAENIAISGRRVQFTIELGGKRKACLARLADLKRIKSSNGHSEMRVVIETEVELGTHRFLADVTLTDRADMGVPMLLGRAAIKGRFLVHAGRTFLLSRRKGKA
jgi:hypothetical protein